MEPGDKGWVCGIGKMWCGRILIFASDDVIDGSGSVAYNDKEWEVVSGVDYYFQFLLEGANLMLVVE